MSEVIYVKGGKSGIASKALVEGQILIDVDNGAYYIDTLVNNVLTRKNISKKPFVGPTAMWEALSDDEKAFYADTFVIITDDLGDASTVMTGATASTPGSIGLVPQPLPGDNTKVLYGDGTWKAIANVIKWIGVTTTALSDGDPTNPIVINGEPVTAVGGDMTAYNGSEFIWDTESGVWQLFGHPTYNFGALAYKDAASGAYTPEGTVGLSQDVAPSTTSVNSITDVGTLPSFSIDGEKAVFNRGTLPTQGSAQTVLTNIGQISASFTGTSDTVIVS